MVLEVDPPMALRNQVVAKLIDLAMAIESGDPILSKSLYREINSLILDGEDRFLTRRAANWICQELFARFHKLPLFCPKVRLLPSDCKQYLTFTAVAIEKKPLHLVIISPEEFESHRHQVFGELTIEKVTLIKPPAGFDDQRLFEDGYELRILGADSGGDIVERMDEIKRSSEDEAIVVVWICKLNQLLQEAMAMGVFEEAMARVKSLKPEAMVVFEFKDYHLNFHNFTKRLAQTFHLKCTWKIEYENPDFATEPWRRRLDRAGFSQIPTNQNYASNIGGSTWIPKYDALNDIKLALPRKQSCNTNTWKLKKWSREEVGQYLKSQIDEGELTKIVQEIRNVTSDPLKASLYNLIIHSTDFRPLNAEQCYVVDLVIDKFLELLKRRSDEFPNLYIKHYSFPTFISRFLLEEKWDLMEKHFKIDDNIRDASKLFMPVCIEKHWILICIDMELRMTLCFDSTRSKESVDHHGSQKEILHKRINSYILRKISTYHGTDWTFHEVVNIPRQTNWVDCGIFVMKYADCLCHGDHFPFTQDDMNHFRCSIASDICREKLRTVLALDIPTQNNLWMDQTINRLAAANEISIIFDRMLFPNMFFEVALTWVCYGSDTDLNSNQKRNLYLLETAFFAWGKDMRNSIRTMFREWNGRHCKEGEGLAGKALQSNMFYISNFKDSDHPINGLKAQDFVPGSALAIGLKSKCFTNDLYVIEFFSAKGHPKKRFKQDILDELQERCDDWRFVSLLKIQQDTTIAAEDCRLETKSSRKRKKASKVWERFDESIKNGEVWATCKGCNKKLRGESGRGTSNLHKHIKKCFEEDRGDVQLNDSVTIVVQNQETGSLDLAKMNNLQFTEMKTHEPQQDTTKAAEDCGLETKSSTKRKNASDVWERCDNLFRGDQGDVQQNLGDVQQNDSAVIQNEANAELNDSGTIVAECNSSFDQETSSLDLAKMIIKHGYPVNMADQHEFFQVFVKNLQPLFKIGSQDDIKADVLRIYKAEKERLVKYHCDLCSRFSLTVDLRSYGDKKIIYCCLILCFIDDEWELKQKILAFKNLGCTVTPETLFEVIQSVLSEWNIEKNVLLVVANDVTSANYCMFGEFGSMSTNPGSGSVFVQCKQLINILVADVECVTGTSVKLESAVELFRASTQQQRIDSDFTKGLEKAIDIRKELKAFHDSLCTSSRIDDLFQSLIFIRNNLHGWKKSEHSYVLEATERMTVKFDKYWEQHSSALGIMAVLDPRFKLCLVEYAYEQIFDDNASPSQFSKFRDLLASTYDRYANASNHQTQSSSSTLKTTDFSMWKQLKGKKERKKNEVDVYLEEEAVELEKDCDVLAWWRANAVKYPVLSRMARDYLAVSMSNIESKSSRINETMKMNPGFDELQPEIIEALICGQDWL